MKRQQGMERPQEPRPEDFGLSTDRLRRLKEDEPNVKLGMTLAAIAAAIATAIAGINIYVFPKSILLTLFLLVFTFFISFIGFGVLSTLVILGVKAIWRRTRVDYPAFKNYEKACAQYKQKLADWLRHQVSWWQSLDGRHFEQELARLLQGRGYNVRWTGKSGDEGIDLVLTKGSHTISVQCKVHVKPVGSGAVRDLYGALMHRKDSEAWLISASGFSRAAYEFAREKPIRLLTIREILQVDPR